MAQPGRTLVASSPDFCFPLVGVSPGGLRPLGSCFSLGGRRMATALHVVGGEVTGIHLVIPRENLSQYQDMTNREYRMFPAELVATDPIRDLAVLEVPGAEASFDFRVTGTDSVTPGDPVVTLGFPHADTGRIVLTQQQTTVGARVLMGNQGIKNKYLVLNTLLRPGQSGGPVINPLTREVVAVLVGAYVPEGPRAMMLIGNLDPATLHQTTHAVSAEYLLAMS